MKRVEKPGTILLFEGKPAVVAGIAEGRTLTLDFYDEPACVHCGASKRVHVLEHSRLFQDRAMPVEGLIVE